MMQQQDYLSIKVSAVSGRYLPPEKIQEVLPAILGSHPVEVLGRSERGLAIPLVRLGSGPIRVLMWSQMHGNETTTTKAVLDLINAYSSALRPTWADSFSLFIIPVLNPDGARAYTRENANGIDLNRDAAKREQVESQILDQCFSYVRPHYCFNLHDQRTIYNPGGGAVPSTLAFLAPSMDAARSAPDNRITAMQLVAAVAGYLQGELPGGIARYDDTFNPNCVGDRFQAKGIPTVLFEAGHYPGDYAREHTRYFVFQALHTILEAIQTESHLNYTVEAYKNIPPNTTDFVDVKILNPAQLDRRYKGREALSLQYREVLRSGEIKFVLDWPEKDLTTARFAHRVIDAENSDDREEIFGNPHLVRLLF